MGWSEKDGKIFLLFLLILLFLIEILRCFEKCPDKFLLDNSNEFCYQEENSIIEKCSVIIKEEIKGRIFFIISLFRFNG